MASPKKQELVSRDKLEAAVVAKATKDPAFRAELLRNPEAVVARELGRPLPPGVKVKVVQETSDTRYIVLPDLGFSLPNLELPANKQASLVGGRAPNRVTSHSTEQCDIC